MSNIKVIILSVLVVFFILISFTTCQSLMSGLQEPVLSLHSVELASINLSNAQMLCKVQIENPNGFEIPFPETDWELFLNTHSFVSGTIKNNNKIKARNTVIVEVPVNLTYLEIFNTFNSLRVSQQADYKVALGLKFSHPLLRERVWNFEHDGSLPIPQLPQVRTPSMRMENANTTRAEIVVTVNMVNPNPFSIPSPKLTYDYQLNRSSFIRGEIDNEGPLAANTTTPVVFRLIVTYADLFRNFAAMRNLFEVNSLLIMTCDFNMPGLNSEPLRFEVAGRLPILR